MSEISPIAHPPESDSSIQKEPIPVALQGRDFMSLTPERFHHLQEAVSAAGVLQLWIHTHYNFAHPEASLPPEYAIMSQTYLNAVMEKINSAKENNLPVLAFIEDETLKEHVQRYGLSSEEFSNCYYVATFTGEATPTGNLTNNVDYLKLRRTGRKTIEELTIDDIQFLKQIQQRGQGFPELSDNNPVSIREGEWENMVQWITHRMYIMEQSVYHEHWEAVANNLKLAGVHNITLSGANYFEKPPRTRAEKIFASRFPLLLSRANVPGGCVGQACTELVTRGIIVDIDDRCIYPQKQSAITKTFLKFIKKGTPFE